MNSNLCKAARALLDWTQADLAKKAGISLTAVKNFESRQGTSRSSTVQNMRLTFEASGIEFMPQGGLRLMDEPIQSYRFSGENCIDAHNEMIYATSKNRGDEILTCSPDDSLWTGQLANHANARFNHWRQKLGIKGKTLTKIGNFMLNEPRHQYRFLAPEVIGTITYVIYAHRISFILWKQRKVFVLQNRPIVDTFKRQFEYLWHIGRIA